MALQFTRAEEVASGKPILATHLSKLARAVNDRLRSGIADSAWRVWFWWLSATRQIRNPDAGANLWPPEDEFLQFYAHVRPQDAQWPVAGAGDPEGINVSSQPGAFVFGNEGMGVSEETGRLDIPLHLGGQQPSRPWMYWALKRWQCGAYDPRTGALGAPALDAARSWSGITYGRYMPQGNSYGGYQPSPLPAEDIGSGIGLCNDADDTATPPKPPTPNFVLYLTSVSATASTSGYHGTVESVGDKWRVSYLGTCPETEGHVQGWGETQWAYQVAVWSGGRVVWDIFPTQDWVEGPYTGEGYLRRRPNGAIQRFLVWFLREFRGSDDQRPSPEQSFDLDAFLTRQYALAPARASVVGDGLSVSWPVFRWNRGQSGKAGLCDQSRLDNWRIREPFVLDSFLVLGEKLKEPATVSCTVDGKTVATVTVTPDEEGTADAIFRFDEPPRGTVRFSVAKVPQMEPGGYLLAECAELLEYKPTLDDAFVVLRLGGYQDSIPDGCGTSEAGAREIWDRYRRFGCVSNAHGYGSMNGPTAEINGNAVFDAMRRMANSCVATIPRENIVGYAVEDGKSVLWLRRYGHGMHNSIPVDLCEGFAPAREAIPSGSLVWGRTYRVASGWIEYAGTRYTTGRTFKARKGRPTYHGDGTVYEADGIRHQAEPGGTTNEWVMWAELAPFDIAGGIENPSSIYKESAYGDYWGHVARQHLFGSVIGSRSEWRMHMLYGMQYAYRPEAPSAYNYAYGDMTHGRLNIDERYSMISKSQQVRFYQSCQIYPPPPEIDKAEVVWESGEEIVKLTFKGRFQSTYGAVDWIGDDETGAIGEAADCAPASIARGSEVMATLNAEPYRTSENGIRAGLAYLNERVPAAVMVGDHANENAYTVPGTGSPEGCIAFRLHAVRLIPEPYLPSDGKYSVEKTLMEHDPMLMVELYVRAMCEGFVSDSMTNYLGCSVTGQFLYDHTYESLCFESTGNRWPRSLPESVRPDNPAGYGPLPTLPAYAEVFNGLVRAVNLLTRARLELPYDVELTTASYRNQRRVGDDPGPMMSWYGTAPAATTAVPDFGMSGGTRGSYLVRDVDGLHIVSERATLTINLTLRDPLSVYAIPEEYRGTYAGQMRVLGEFTDTAQWHPSRSGSDTTSDCSDGILTVSFRPGFTTDGWDVRDCRVFGDTVLDPGAPRASWHWDYDADGFGCTDHGELRSMTFLPVADTGLCWQVPLA